MSDIHINSIALTPAQLRKQREACQMATEQQEKRELLKHTSTNSRLTLRLDSVLGVWLRFIYSSMLKHGKTTLCILGIGVYLGFRQKLPLQHCHANIALAVAIWIFKR